MPDKVRIALDAMGGDHGASVVVPGRKKSTSVMLLLTAVNNFCALNT